jgi:hypothetical protein
MLLSCNNKDVIRNNSRWPKIDISFKTPLVIGDDSTAFLSHPEYVVTDSESHVIIADAGQKKLLVFNQEGSLLYTIGKKGHGPDEFRNIQGMTIDSNDIITVFDRGAQALKRFNSSGKYLNSVVMNEPIYSGVEFDRWDNYHFLYYVNYNFGAEENHLLHVYSGNYHLIESKISLQSLKNLNQSLLNLFIGDTGSHFVSGNTLYFSPHIYNGYIYKFTITSNMQEINIKLNKKFLGLIYKKSPAQRFNGKELVYADVNETIPGGKHYQYLVHNQSKGLFQLENGDIVHFTYIESKQPHKRVFGIELYDRKMHPIGYAPIKTLMYNNHNKSNLLSWNVVWKDKKDRFYIIDTQHIPKVRVVKLQINKK